MKPESVLRAIRLIRTGEVIELGQVLNSSMPIYGPRRFDLFTKRTSTNSGINQRGGNEELIVSEITQVGTQLDGFAHQTIGDSLYNCVSMTDVATRDGFKELGIEKVGSMVTRGVLIDVAALKGVQTLSETYEITAQDLQQALARQKMTLQPGDAVLIHTGWGRLWGKENARYEKSRPGIGVGAATLNPAGGAGDNPSAQSFSIGAGIWWTLAGIIASFAGGYASGRLSGKPKDGTAGWHGLTTWALTTLGIFYLLAANAERALEEVGRFTRNDRYKRLDGHRTFTSHYHIEHTLELIKAQTDAKRTFFVN
jgi:hypothetical protein